MFPIDVINVLISLFNVTSIEGQAVAVMAGLIIWLCCVVLVCVALTGVVMYIIEKCNKW